MKPDVTLRCWTAVSLVSLDVGSLCSAGICQPIRKNLLQKYDEDKKNKAQGLKDLTKYWFLPFFISFINPLIEFLQIIPKSKFSNY